VHSEEPSPLDSARIDERPRVRRPFGRHLRGREALLLWLSLGTLVLGIGLVFFALANVFGAKSTGNAFFYRATPSSPAAVATSQTPLADPQNAGAPSSSPGTAPIRYAERPREGEPLGRLSIPALRQTLPIVEGTRTNDLKKGVGHFTRSVLPGAVDNCVLSGHRDTVFTRLGELKKGDFFVVQTANGVFTYQINRIRIVHANDKTVIVPADHAVLTVTTCYPFHYVGSAPDRYILSADMVGSQPPL
jgi:sortase A